MGWAYRTYGEIRPVYILIEKPKVKELLGRPGRRWKDDIKRDIREVGCQAGLHFFVSR
jgi:hypothetical protein